MSGGMRPRGSLASWKIAVALLALLSLSGAWPALVPATGWLFGALLLLILAGEARAAHARGGAWAAAGRFVERNAFTAALGAIALLGLAFRLKGIGMGLGHQGLGIDETRLATSVQHFFTSGVLDHATSEEHPGPHYWLLAGGSLLAFVHGLTSGALGSIDRAPLELFAGAGRATNAVLGAATVFLTGLLARRLSGAAAGLLAGLLVAVVPLAIETSTVLRNDVGLAFFVAACAWASLGSLGDPRSAPVALAGALAGCATATKYTGVFTLLTAGLAAAFESRGLERATRLALAVAMFALAVALTNHFVWADFPNFLQQLSMDHGHVREGHFAATANPRLAYTTALADGGVGWPLLVLAGIAAGIGLAMGGARVWVVASFPIAYLAFMTGKDALFSRWAYPLLPFVAVAAAAGLVALPKAIAGTGLRVGRPLHIALALALLAPALWPGAVAISRRFAPPTYAIAEAWLASERAPGVRVLAAPFMLPSIRPEALGGSRRVALRELLDARSHELAAYDFIVVPEALFTHPRLAELRLLRAFENDHGWRGSRGADIRVYAAPPVAPVAALRVVLDAPESAAFLGVDWRRDAQGPGLALPADGASLYLPIAVTPETRLELETAPAGDAPAPAVSMLLDGLKVAPGASVGPRLPRASRAGIHVLRLEARRPVRVATLSVR
jgi:hypothetical protein